MEIVQRESLMAKFIRKQVSKKKKRFESNGFNLDLTYITPQIIAMGFPSEGAEGLYRNPLSEVRRFLDHYHPQSFKIYNLCSERSYDIAKFDNRVECFPFDDHNAPPIGLLEKFTSSAASWLGESPKNVVVVHCKAGKGRTGVMICCLLLSLKLFPSATEALTFYGIQRTENGKGVTIPSQIRYVHYYEEILKEGMKLKKVIQLSHIRMHTIPDFDVGGGCDPYVVVFMDKSKVFEGKPLKNCKNISFVDIQCNNITVSDNVKIALNDYDHLGEHDKMCHFWIHTSFLPDNGYISLTKEEIDAANKDGKNEHFKPDFRIEVFYTVIDSRKRERSVGPPSPCIAQTHTETLTSSMSMPLISNIPAELTEATLGRSHSEKLQGETFETGNGVDEDLEESDEDD